MAFRRTDRPELPDQTVIAAAPPFVALLVELHHPLGHGEAHAADVGLVVLAPGCPALPRGKFWIDGRLLACPGDEDEVVLLVQRWRHKTPQTDRAPQSSHWPICGRWGEATLSG